MRVAAVAAAAAPPCHQPLSAADCRAASSGRGVRRGAGRGGTSGGGADAAGRRAPAGPAAGAAGHGLRAVPEPWRGRWGPRGEGRGVEGRLLPGSITPRGRTSEDPRPGPCMPPGGRATPELWRQVLPAARTCTRGPRAPDWRSPSIPGPGRGRDRVAPRPPGAADGEGGVVSGKRPVSRPRENAGRLAAPAGRSGTERPGAQEPARASAARTWRGRFSASQTSFGPQGRRAKRGRLSEPKGGVRDESRRPWPAETSCCVTVKTSEPRPAPL